ncbi:MAG: hypothetical protein R3F43_23470 [bacterium]
MKPLEVVPIEPPPADQRVARGARFPAEGERKTRYSLPTRLESSSPVGYRRRLSMTRAEAAEALPLLSMSRPTAFAAAQPVTEQALRGGQPRRALGAPVHQLPRVSAGYLPERSAELHALLGRLLRAARPSPWRAQLTRTWCWGVPTETLHHAAPRGPPAGPPAADGHAPPLAEAGPVHR